jgi:pimeloyl-ACP methyl ester carboxylesterase
MWHAANTKKTLCFALSARIVSLMAVALFVLASAAFAAKFESDLCPADQAVALAKLKASCGYLIVPENRTKKNPRTIRLPVAIIPSRSQPQRSDPIVYMAGGPGANAIAQAEILASVGLNQNRTLIIMNQRGVADTQPALTCPEIDEFNIEAVGLPYNSPKTGKLHVAATKKCHDRLVAQGIDLSAYNTTESSADFADLRKALNIKQWNVYGLSYGTDLALSLMRDHPDGIRSVIIDSVVPPSVATQGWLWTNVNEAVHNLFRTCAAQAKCKKQYGDLAATFASQVRRREANPLTIRVKAPFGKVDVLLDGGALVNWIGSIPADPVLPIPSYPSAIAELAQGNPTQIAGSRAFLADPAAIGAVGYGLQYGVICSEWVPFEPVSQILVQGLLAFPTYPEPVLSQAPGLPFLTQDCGVWNVPKAPGAVRQLTISSIPTLVMAGDFDGKTSPQWAVYAAGTLEKSTTVVIPGAGHGALFQIGLPNKKAKDCAQSVVASFLSNPMKPNTGCVATLKAPNFTT